MTLQTQLGKICPMFQEEDCRFLSQERTSRPFTKIEKDTTTGLYKPIGMGRRKVILGQFCNNHFIGKSGWVDEMTVCPSRWALHRGFEKKKEGKKK